MSVQQCLKTYLKKKAEAPKGVNTTAGLLLYAHLLVKGGSDTLSFKEAMLITEITNRQRYYALKHWLVESGLIVSDGNVLKVVEMKDESRGRVAKHSEDVKVEEIEIVPTVAVAHHSKQEEILQVSLVTEMDRDLEERYKKLDKEDKTALFNFIKDHKPMFLAPYMDAWNRWAIKHQNPQVKSVTQARKVKFKQRMSEKNFDFLELMKMAVRSTGVHGASWFTFDWLFNSETNYTKLSEGNYIGRLSEPKQKEEPKEVYNPGDARLAELLNNTTKKLT